MIGIVGTYPEVFRRGIRPLQYSDRVVLTIRNFRVSAVHEADITLVPPTFVKFIAIDRIEARTDNRRMLARRRQSAEMKSDQQPVIARWRRNVLGQCDRESTLARSARSSRIRP